MRRGSESEPDVPHVSAKKVAERLAAGEDLVILDVREPMEHRMAHVDGTLDIPMGDVPERADELPKDKEIVCMCHHGVRSHAVAQFLRRHGLNAVNLTGGIDAWAREVDADVGSY